MHGKMRCTQVDDTDLFLSWLLFVPGSQIGKILLLLQLIIIIHYYYNIIIITGLLLQDYYNSNCNNPQIPTQKIESELPATKQKIHKAQTV